MKPAARSTFGSHGIAAKLWRLAREAHGDDHPATRAALGRLLYHRGSVPQFDSRTPEAIAWYRESGLRPGFLNRAERSAKISDAALPSGSAPGLG